MIACSDSDPFKAITRQNMESKAGDYSVNDFFFLALFSVWSVTELGMWINHWLILLIVRVWQAWNRI